ncbi:MAG: flavin reductase family protein [Pseudomonadota bacterium]
MEIHLAAITDRERSKVLTGLVVPRPIAFVSTRSPEGRFNAAPFSFFNLMSVSPPIVVIGVNRRPGGNKDTYTNIQATGEFVVNIVSAELGHAMNQSSLESPPEIDEFEVAGLTAVPSLVVGAPRVGEAPAHLECRLNQWVNVGAGKQFIVGDIVHMHVRDDIVSQNFRIDQGLLDPLGRMGGVLYTRTRDTFPMERPDTEAMLAAFESRRRAGDR